MALVFANGPPPWHVRCNTCPTMIHHIGMMLMVIGLILPASVAIAGVPDSPTAEAPGSLGAKIRDVLDTPPASGGGQDASNYRDPSLEYYYSKLGGRAAGIVLDDTYAAGKRPRGTVDSSDSPKKPPTGQIAEPGVLWLFFAG